MKLHQLYYVLLAFLTTFFLPNLRAHGFDHYTLIKTASRGTANCYFKLSFEGKSNCSLKCTPSQEFYKQQTGEWVPACSLHVGDVLLSAEGSCTIVHIDFIQKKLPICAMELESEHIYFVGSQEILTHNMAIPFVFAGLGFSFGTGAAVGGATGCFLGPISIIGGAVIGGVCGFAAKTMFDNYGVRNYSVVFDQDIIEKYRNATYLEKDSKESVEGEIPGGAQAPGKPTENDGFVPSKKWDGKKVRNPNGSGFGWPDEKGRVWVPTGPGPKAHRGPHWDVQLPDGNHINVMPGGKILG